MTIQTQLDNDQSDHGQPGLSPKDLGKAVTNIVSFSDTNFQEIKQGINRLQETLNEFCTEMHPVIAQSDGLRQKGNMAAQPFTNYHSDLTVNLEDVLEQLQ